MFRTALRALIYNHRLAGLILLIFISLAITYSLVTPPFEAGDESRHYAVVKYLVDSGRLPIQNAPETGEIQHHWSHEGNQPPLYYALAAGLTSRIDTGSWDDVFWYNPHTSIGNPLRPDNKNITIHPPGETWPWRGHVLAVYLIRFLSITMALVTVIAAYAIALRLYRGNRGLAAGAMALTAFNPMFIFISASVNNDNAVIMFVTLALWVMVRTAEDKSLRDFLPRQDEETGRAGARQFKDRSPLTTVPLYLPVLLGLIIGLGALSKLYAFGLLPLTVLLFFWLAYQIETPKLHRQSLFSNPVMRLKACLRSPALWRQGLLWSTTFAIVFFAVAGWFYVRNAILYNGDFLALEVMRNVAGQRREIPSLATMRAEFEGFRIAYWALFGGVNILVAPWIYRILDGVSLIAITGVFAFLVRLTYRILRTTRYTLRPKSHDQHPPVLSLVEGTPLVSLPTFTLLFLWYLIMLAGFITWNVTQPAGQGRLMYPAIAAISALGLLGLTWWLPGRLQQLIAVGCGTGLFVFAALSPFLYIAPAYAKPATLTEADLPADLQPIDFTYDGKLRLIGYEIQPDIIRPAQNLSVTLYWELLEPTTLNYSVFIHLLGRQRRVVGQLDTYPGGGKWPTTLLKPGDILADQYDVAIKPQAEFEHAPTRLLIAAGIYDLQEPGRPGKPTINLAGEPVEPIIASAKLIPWQWPSPPTMETPVNFFDKITLLSYQVSDDRQTITFNWQANQPLESDYTVFVQAWQANSDDYTAGFDGPPVQNDYPTSMWAPGEIIVDPHPVDLSILPSGEYYLLAGLYNPITAERLPAFGADGPLPGYAVNVGTVRVDSGME